jgi:hypothetical protein
MSEGDKDNRPLFELTASECDEWLEGFFKDAKPTHPIKCSVAAALMVAEAATQHIALRVLDRINADGQCDWPEYLALPQDLFNLVEDLNNYLFSRHPARIDMVLWDATGYIHGWYLTDQGKPDIARGSCPETVLKLSEVLQQLALCDIEWRPVLERHAKALGALWLQAREKAEVVSREKVASQGWMARLFNRTSVERELLSLGFR